MCGKPTSNGGFALRAAAGVYQQEQAAQAGVEDEAGEGDRDNAGEDQARVQVIAGLADQSALATEHRSTCRRSVWSQEVMPR